MVERRFLPRPVIVTVLALRAFLPFMLVILLVTRVAVQLQFILVKIPFVAAYTFHFTMFSNKRVFGLEVIEEDLFPTTIDVTAFAFLPKIPLVLVILLMA